MIQNFIDVLKKYSVLTGRASRREYWLFVLVSAIIYVVLDIILNVLHSSVLAAVIAVLVLAAFALPSLGVTVRRLHDTNRSGWWILITFVPFIGGIILLIFTILDSTPGDNKYGPNPKGVVAGAGVGSAAGSVPVAPTPEPVDLNPHAENSSEVS